MFGEFETDPKELCKRYCECHTSTMREEPENAQEVFRFLTTYIYAEGGFPEDIRKTLQLLDGYCVKLEMKVLDQQERFEADNMTEEDWDIRLLHYELLMTRHNLRKSKQMTTAKSTLQQKCNWFETVFPHNKLMTGSKLASLVLGNSAKEKC